MSSPRENAIICAASAAVGTPKSALSEDAVSESTFKGASLVGVASKYIVRPPSPLASCGLPAMIPGTRCPAPPRVTERPSRPSTSSASGSASGKAPAIVHDVSASARILPSAAIAGWPLASTRVPAKDGSLAPTSLSFLTLPTQAGLARSSTWNSAIKTLSVISARLKTLTGTEAATNVVLTLSIWRNISWKVATSSSAFWLSGSGDPVPPERA